MNLTSPDRHHRGGRSRRELGQSLVEFAMVLPVMLFLLLIALDFGRVYLGWINLQNMSRIAANYAANNPDAWGATPNGTVQTQYRNQILADAAATNCRLPQSGGSAVVPAPTFTDVNANGVGLGDTVTVGLTCTFDVITPLVSSVVGGSVAVSAEASFPVKSGLSAVAGGGSGGGGGGGGNPSAPNAAFSANGIISPDPITSTSPFDVEFRDTSGGAPTSWSWDFGDGTYSTAQDPLNHTFSCAVASCTYNVRLTATNLAGASTAQMVVTVTGQTTVDFTANKVSGDRPLAVTFTDASTPGGTAYAWNFGDGTTGSGATVTHTYSSAVGSPFTVTLTVTYPGPVTSSVTKTAFISVSVPQCTVPSLNGVRFNSAQGVWTGAGFTGTVTRAPGAPTGNFFITAQSLTATSLVSCDLGVQVSRP